MQIIHTVAELRAALAGRADLSFVPTMGNLHAGHLSLIEQAAARGRPVVASIFGKRHHASLVHILRVLVNIRRP